MKIDNGVFEVVYKNGDKNIGGEEFDKSVMDNFIKL